MVVAPLISMRRVGARIEMSGIEAHLGLNTWTSSFGYCLAYSDVKGYRVVAGEPQCPQGILRDVLSEFEEDCRYAGRKVVYFGLPVAVIETLGWHKSRGSLPIGDIPVFDLTNWIHPSLWPRNIQSQQRRAVNHGVTVRHLAAPPKDMGPLLDCLSAWLKGKRLSPMGFATNPFLLEPWPRHGVFIAEKDGRVCGFTLFSNSLFRNMLRIDAVVRTPHAPNGCAELLVASIFQAAAMMGFKHATLGLAPLSKRSGASHFNSPIWFTMFSAAARRLGPGFYSFQGLEAFKAKFHPNSWQPLFCVSRHRDFSPSDLMAVLRAFAGGSLVKYAMTGLGKFAGCDDYQCTSKHSASARVGIRGLFGFKSLSF